MNIKMLVRYNHCYHIDEQCNCLRNGIKKKTTTKCNSNDLTEDKTCQPKAHTDKSFQQSQCSKVNEYQNIICTLFLKYRNINIPLRSSNSFQIGHFQDVLIPKSIKSKPEPHQYHGFYIEAGAGDGEIISNSLYFEINYKVIRNLIINNL